MTEEKHSTDNISENLNKNVLAQCLNKQVSKIEIHKN
jgi:hypothetical protein